jgi:NADPH:quinone reductase-like Zn-dependent oxidoreductase
LALFLDAGQLTTLVQQVLPLREARQAHELLEKGLGRPGKLVLKVTGS